MRFFVCFAEKLKSTLYCRCGKMKKNIIALIVVIVLIGVFFSSYRNVNRQFPAAVVKTTQMGEQVEFQKEILILVEEKEIVSEEKKKKFTKKTNIDLMLTRSF